MQSSSRGERKRKKRSRKMQLIPTGHCTFTIMSFFECNGWCLRALLCILTALCKWKARGNNFREKVTLVHRNECYSFSGLENLIRQRGVGWRPTKRGEGFSLWTDWDFQRLPTDSIFRLKEHCIAPLTGRSCCTASKLAHFMASPSTFSLK